MILHPMSGESSINQISDLHNYMINSKVDSKLKKSLCLKSDRLPKRKEILSHIGVEAQMFLRLGIFMIINYVLMSW